MKLKFLLAWLCSLSGLLAGPLKIGSPLPELSAMNHRGEQVKLAPTEGDESVFIFTYPMAMTPG